MLAVVGQFILHNVPLKLQAALKQLPKYLVIYHQVFLTAMTNESFKLTQISKEAT